MATQLESPRPALSPPPHIGDILHRIVDDLKILAKDEVELARIEIEKSAKTAAADAAVVMLSGFSALVGMAFVGGAIIAALGPVISLLWIRCLIVAVLYIGGGALLGGYFAKKLSRDVTPDLAEPVAEAKETAEDIKQGLAH